MRPSVRPQPLRGNAVCVQYLQPPQDPMPRPLPRCLLPLPPQHLQLPPRCPYLPLPQCPQIRYSDVLYLDVTVIVTVVTNQPLTHEYCRTLKRSGLVMQAHCLLSPRQAC